MKIRRAQPKDCTAIEVCARAAYEKYVGRIGKEPAPMVADFRSQINDGKVLVVENESGVIAFAVCYALNDDYHLENIAVAPEYQSTGVGRHLIESIHQRAKQAGIDVISLYTNEKMVENLVWYQQLGYTETGRCCEDGFNRVYFKKRL